MAEIILIRPSVLPPGIPDKESRPPAGLLYVAAPLVQHGFDVMIIDQTVEANWKGKLIEAIDSKTLCIGITCITGYMIINGMEIVKIAREYTKCPIVWGGVHSSLEPDTTINSEYVDIIVAGEGEETFLELVIALKNGTSLEKIEGIIFKKDVKVYKNNHRGVYDLNMLPSLPIHLVDMDRYKNHPQLSSFFHFQSPLALSIETSRGCAYKCTYCVMSNENYKNRSYWRGMSAYKLADTIEDIIKRYKISSFAFIDDNFFVDINRVKEFLNEIEKRKLDIEWFGDIRMDTIAKKMDKAFLQRLEKAGLCSLGIGIESGSNRILKYLRKGETRETIIEANRMLASTNIVPQYGFIQGLPNEKRKDFEETYSLLATLVIENSKAVPTLNKLLPTPNTPIFEDCKKAGLIQPERFEDWAYYCDTGWQHGPEVWMDKEAVTLRMSLSYYYALINKTRRFRANFGRKSIWDVILNIASRALLFRIRRNFFNFNFENIVLKIIVALPCKRFFSMVCAPFFLFLKRASK